MPSINPSRSSLSNLGHGDSPLTPQGENWMKFGSHLTTATPKHRPQKAHFTRHWTLRQSPRLNPACERSSSQHHAQRPHRFEFRETGPRLILRGVFGAVAPSSRGLCRGYLCHLSLTTIIAHGADGEAPWVPAFTRTFFLRKGHFAAHVFINALFIRIST